MREQISEAHRSCVNGLIEVGALRGDRRQGMRILLPYNGAKAFPGELRYHIGNAVIQPYPALMDQSQKRGRCE